MITYETKDDKTFKVTTIREEIDVKALEAELKVWLEIKEPSDAELIEAGRFSHPYYEKESVIKSLENKLEKVK